VEPFLKRKFRRENFSDVLPELSPTEQVDELGVEHSEENNVIEMTASVIAGASGVSF